MMRGLLDREQWDVEPYVLVHRASSPNHPSFLASSRWLRGRIRAVFPIQAWTAAHDALTVAASRYVPGSPGTGSRRLGPWHAGWPYARLRPATAAAARL